ncbi:hypothetical protein [Celeribacter persicus]|uniref:Uncharacterized protein n=1 Tax=Celeribacter persicus TaxID=1651082 RepID=A0A2T5HGV4_9RHOB|nr:hypothetical protein [Celeribacter persicus]PTQ70794.1 hypothetical protein C8N42_109123 [Celeribacter persicus]
MRGALLCSVALLSACQMTVPGVVSDPPVSQDDVPASEVPADQLAQAFAEAAVLAKAGKNVEDKGLFAFLIPASKPEPSPLAGSDIEVVETSEAESGVALLVSKNAPAAANGITAQTTKVKTAGLGGVFGFLKPKDREAQEVELAAVPLEGEGFTARPETHGVESEVSPEVEAETPVAPHKPLFGFLKPQAAEGPVPTVKPGEVLPFGEVGVACEVKSMGRKVDQFPREGRPIWQLYDSDPESTAPRSQFITGFSDGCVRQVTAALVMFGEAALHEVLRYSGDTDRDWTKADKTYETIKRQTCGVGRGERCPEGKIGALERQVAFVSVYPEYGAEEDWLELLLHDGTLVSEEMR